MKNKPVAFGGLLAVGVVFVALGSSPGNTTFLPIGVVFMVIAVAGALLSRRSSSDEEHNKSE